jgi:TPR repeat protein
LNPDIFNPEPKDARIIELNQREGNYEKGLRAYRAGDYHHAFDLLQSEARYSVVKATLGFMYFMGLGVTRDYEKAIEWFMAAALQGHVLAQRNLGNIFAAGYGVEQDYLEAFKWYLMAAQNRDTSAQKRVADMYVLGLGVMSDKEQALRWYRKAADDGDPAAGYYYNLLDNRGLDACQALLIGDLEPEPVEGADGSLQAD